MRVEREAPTTAGEGIVRCKVCGREWGTTHEEDALLAKLFDHDAAHDEGVTKGGRSTWGGGGKMNGGASN